MKCKGCFYCQKLRNDWCCARGKHRFSIIDPEREFPDEQGGCYVAKNSALSEGENINWKALVDFAKKHPEVKRTVTASFRGKAQ